MTQHWEINFHLKLESSFHLYLIAYKHNWIQFLCFWFESFANCELGACWLSSIYLFFCLWFWFVLSASVITCMLGRLHIDDYTFWIYHILVIFCRVKPNPLSLMNIDTRCRLKHQKVHPHYGTQSRELQHISLSCHLTLHLVRVRSFQSFTFTSINHMPMHVLTCIRMYMKMRENFEVVYLF